MDNSLPEKLFTCRQIRALDHAAITKAKIPGIQLMKRAAREAFNLMLDEWPEVEYIVVFCGGGNNGGDGYVLAALAAQRCIPVTVYSLIDPDDLKGDAQRAYSFARQEQVEIVPAKEYHSAADYKNIVLVDAILGTGFKGELRENIRVITQILNSSDRPVLSLDIPSGLDGDSGLASSGAIKANVTMTFVGVKQGMLTANGPEHCGELFFSNLDIPEAIYRDVEVGVTCVKNPKALPRKKVDAHKGDFGHVLIIGGDLGMGGAALLAAEAALLTGAGLVSLATRSAHIPSALARVPEVMALGVSSGAELDSLIQKAEVIVLGPGLGKSAWSEQLLVTALNASLPMVIDADALNLLAAKESVGPTNRRWIITPHPGEAARLLRCSAAKVQADRFAAADTLQKRFGAVVVLKGAGTLIANGSVVKLAHVGNPGMAVAGMGDVLSGILGGLLAQGEELMEAAVSGVCIHGIAGDKVAELGQRGIKASDLMPAIRTLVNLPDLPNSTKKGH